MSDVRSLANYGDNIRWLTENSLSIEEHGGVLLGAVLTDDSSEMSVRVEKVGYYTYLGVASSTMGLNRYVSPRTGVLLISDGRILKGGTSGGDGVSFSAGDLFWFRFNAESRCLSWSVNGAEQPLLENVGCPEEGLRFCIYNTGNITEVKELYLKQGLRLIMCSAFSGGLRCTGLDGGEILQVDAEDVRSQSVAWLRQCLAEAIAAVPSDLKLVHDDGTPLNDDFTLSELFAAAEREQVAPH